MMGPGMMGPGMQAGPPRSVMMGSGMNPGMMRGMMPPPPPPAAPAAAVKHGPAPAGVAATVNGIPIKTTQVQDLAMQASGQQVLDQLITATVIDQQAKKENAIPTPAQIAAKITELRRQISAQYPGQTLETMLASRGVTMTRVKSVITTQLEVQNLVERDIKPIQMWHVRHILIMTHNPNNDPSVKPHTEADAQAIIAKIQADLAAGKSFEYEATQYTEDPSGKQNGGDLPVINATSPFDQTFLKAAIALRKGQVTPTPVESIYGLHLIYCVSTSDDPTPEDQAQYQKAADDYKQQQMAMNAQSYVQSLKDKATIVNYLAPPPLPVATVGPPPGAIRGPMRPIAQAAPGGPATPVK
jgi:foldase protein PrsA